MKAMLSQCFIGGWGATEEVWRGVLDEAPKANAHLKPEEGLNGPPAPAHFVSWLDCIRDWPGVLRSLSALPGRCVLVGWSLGSVLALRASQELAGPLPEKVAALVLVSATPCMCAHAEAAGDGHGGIDPRMLAAMRVRMRRSPDAVLEDFAVQCAAPDGDVETRLSWLRQARRFSAAELMAGLDCLASLDVREHLEEIAVPCRILHGDGDRIVPLGSAQFLAGRMSGAELEVLAGRGHALPFTARREISRCVATVLASVLE